MQFERERSRALSKDLLAARERWQATEAERAAAEDSRRWVVKIEAAIDCCVECVTACRVCHSLQAAVQVSSHIYRAQHSVGCPDVA